MQFNTNLAKNSTLLQLWYWKTPWW